MKSFLNIMVLLCFFFSASAQPFNAEYTGQSANFSESKQTIVSDQNGNIVFLSKDNTNGFFINKVSATGVPIIRKKITNNTNIVGYAIINTFDNGFLVVGELDLNTTYFQSTTFYAKLDNVLNVTIIKQHNSNVPFSSMPMPNLKHRVYGIGVVKDGTSSSDNYYILNRIYDAKLNQKYFSVLKVNSLLNTVWETGAGTSNGIDIEAIAIGKHGNTISITADYGDLPNGAPSLTLINTSGVSLQPLTVYNVPTGYYLRSMSNPITHPVNPNVISLGYLNNPSFQVSTCASQSLEGTLTLLGVYIINTQSIYSSYSYISECAAQLAASLTIKDVSRPGLKVIGLNYPERPLKPTSPYSFFNSAFTRINASTNLPLSHRNYNADIINYAQSFEVHNTSTTDLIFHSKQGNSSRVIKTNFYGSTYCADTERVAYSPLNITSYIPVSGTGPDSPSNVIPIITITPSTFTLQTCNYNYNRVVNEHENVLGMDGIIYPNPANSGETISVSVIGSANQIAVYNVLGNKVSEKLFQTKSDFIETLDLQAAPGLYYIHVLLDKNIIINRKIIIK